MWIISFIQDLPFQYIGNSGCIVKHSTKEMPMVMYKKCNGCERLVFMQRNVVVMHELASFLVGRLYHVSHIIEGFGTLVQNETDLGNPL